MLDVDAVTHRMGLLAHKIRDNEGTTDAKIRNLEKIFRLCHPASDDFRIYQEGAYRAGVSKVLVDHILSENVEDECRLAGFLAIGSLTFHNDKVSILVGMNVDFVNQVAALLDSTETSDDLKFSALNAASNTANSAEVHDNVIRLVPATIRLFETSNHNKLRGQVVTFIGLLAYQEQCRSRLREFGAIPVFWNVIQNPQNIFLRPASAALSLSNLGAIPCGDEIRDDTVVVEVVNVLTATINGEDHPRGSAVFYTTWKVMRSVSNMCVKKVLVRRLRELKINNLVALALSNPNGDTRLTEASLHVLWRLGDQRTNV